MFASKPGARMSPVFICIAPSQWVGVVKNCPGAGAVAETFDECVEPLTDSLVECSLRGTVPDTTLGCAGGVMH